MNIISTCRMIAFSLILEIVSCLGFFAIGEPEAVKASFGIFGLGLLIYLLYILNLADLRVESLNVQFVYAYRKRVLLLSTLEIGNIKVTPRGPLFVVSTNKGNYRVNFTKANYEELGSVLEKCKFSRISITALKEKVASSWDRLKQ